MATTPSATSQVPYYVHLIASSTSLVASGEAAGVSVDRVIDKPEKAQRGITFMPKITFIEHDGTVYSVEAEIGSTVMEIGLRNGVASIVAECGGSCACATCLVHVDDAWSAIVGPPSADEEEMLDSAFEAKSTSRLSCQIKITQSLDGLVVYTPTYQGR